MESRNLLYNSARRLIFPSSTQQEIPLPTLYDQVTITAAHEYVKKLSQRVAYAPTFDTVYLVKDRRLMAPAGCQVAR